MAIIADADVITMVINTASIPVVLGIQGTVGATGSQGIQGVAGGSYIYPQVTPSSVWVITHNKNGYPAVITEDTAGTVVEGSVIFNSVNQLTIQFTSAFAGTAYLII